MRNASWPEGVLFLLLLAASLYGFWIRFRKVVRNIRGSKAEADSPIRPLGRRVRNFVWEVLLQGHVIRERPLVGLAHAFVFWGFCSFALVTVNHLAQGLGAGFLVRESVPGRIYFNFVVCFAAAVAVSIAGLAARRFLVRPKWLGEVSPESGLIAFLIFALMVTYLATFLVAENSVAGKINWWLHTAALLVFLPVVPHTKHLHLVLSPLTVFLKRPSFSRIPPLAGDEDFGIVSGTDVTSLVALQAYTCVECGRCTEHCPASNTGKLLNPKEIVLGVRRFLNENGPRSAEAVMARHLSQEAVFQCTTCGACEYQCPVGIQHLPVIVGLRRGAVNTGAWEDDYGTKLFLNLERSGNPLGFSSGERDKFIGQHALAIYDGTQEYCLWLGCMGSYDPAGREIVLALAEVLRALKVSFGVLRKERCSGDSARRLGNDLLFQQLVEANLEEFRRSGVRKMLSICPHCVRTLAEDWREYGAEVEIEHHSEFLARHAAALALGGQDRQRVVFHDPCYLGRYRNVYDEPRRVIERTAALVEPRRSRRRSFCCGAGGGLVFLGEEKGKRVSAERAEELAATGAEVVGAACPFCNTMFRDALAGISPAPPKLLLDIAQLAAASLKAGSKGNVV